MIKRIKIRSIRDVSASYRAYSHDFFIGGDISSIKGVCIAIENLKQSSSNSFFPVFVLNVDLSINNTIPLTNYLARIVTLQPSTYRNSRTLLNRTISKNIKYLPTPLKVNKGSFLRTVIQELPSYNESLTSYDVVLYIDYTN